MKNVLLALLVTVTLFLAGCAFTDRFLLKREVQDGVELYTDSSGNPTKDAVDPVTGKSNEPRYESAPAAGVSGLASLLRIFPGWGDAAFYGVVSLASIYATIRAKKFTASRARQAAIRAGMPIVLSIVADIKSGVLDTDKDGVVSISEIAEYIKKKALASLTPEGIQGIVKVVYDAVMPEPEKTVALEDIAAEL